MGSSSASRGRLVHREPPVEKGGAHARFDFEGNPSGWMAWHFKPRDGDTQVAVKEEYTAPGSVLGRVADRSFRLLSPGNRTRASGPLSNRAVWGNLSSQLKILAYFPSRIAFPGSL